MASAELSLNNGELTGSLTTFTYTAEATPLTPDDTAGAVASFTAGIQEWDDSITVDGQAAVLQIDGQNTLVGEVQNPSSDITVVSLSGISMLNRFNSTRTVAPYHGTLSGYLTYLGGIYGISTTYTLGPGVVDVPIDAEGYHDNGWAQLKAFLSARGLEIADGGDAFNVRLTRQRIIDLDEHPFAQAGWSSESSDLAQSIDVMDYETQYLEDHLIYPPAIYDDANGTTSAPGWRPDTEVITVDPGQMLTMEVPIEGSLFSVEQPVCVKSVKPTDGAGGSVYTVAAQGSADDGDTALFETLDPAEWSRRGGYVRVKIGANYDTIIITVNGGSNLASLGTLAIAMTDGQDYYSSLRIRGTGIMHRRQRISLPTGLSEAEASSDVGNTVDTPYISGADQAVRVGHDARVHYSHPTISVTGTFVDTGLAAADVVGARFHYLNAWYRITQASISENGVQVTAESDTTVDDLTAEVGGLTFDGLTARWAGKTFRDLGAAPLV